MAVNSEKAVLYLNINILDAKQAIKDTVNKRVSKAPLPGPIKKLAGKAAYQVAREVVTPSAIAKKVGKKLCKKIPAKMEKKGISAVLEEVFREETYVVLQLQVQHVETVALTRSQSSGTRRIIDLFIFFIQMFFVLIGVKSKKSIEENILPPLVQTNLESALDELMEEKLLKKKLIAETKVLAESKQARYFFAKLQEVQESDGHATRSLVKKARRKMKNKGIEDDSSDSDSSSSSSSDDSSDEDAPAIYIIEENDKKLL